MSARSQTALAAHAGGIASTALLLATALAAWRHDAAEPSAVALCFVLGWFTFAIVLAVTTVPALLPLALLDTARLMRWPGEGLLLFALAYGVGMGLSVGLAVLILGFPGFEPIVWITGILLVQVCAATVSFALLHRAAFVRPAAACLSARPWPHG